MQTENLTTKLILLSIIVISIIGIFVLFIITLIGVYFFKRRWLKSKCKLVWTPISGIERRSNLLYDEFVQQYASIGKPVIITDVVKKWEASSKWTIDFFREKYGAVRTDGVRDRNIGTNISMTIRDYMDYLEADETEKSLYLIDFPLFDHPELYEDCEVPIYCDNLLEQLPEKLLNKYGFHQYIFLFMGRKESSIGLHVDEFYTQAWLGVIYGRKRFILISPDQEKFVYGGKVNAFNPDLEKFPLYANAKPVEFILNPGEIIYIPSMWWHQAQNLDSTIALGFNTVNEWNLEMVLNAANEVNPIIGNLLGLLLEFPWLGKVVLASRLL